MKVAKINT